MTNPCDDNNRFYSSVDRAWASDKEAKANLKAWATEARSKTAEATAPEVDETRALPAVSWAWLNEAEAAEAEARAVARAIEWAARVEAAKAVETAVKAKVEAARVVAWHKAAEVERVKAAEVWAKAEVEAAKVEAKAKAEFEAKANRIKAEANRIKAESEAWAKASWFTKLWMWLDKNG